MSDFIFKIPELPEDALLNRRKISGGRENKSDKNGGSFCVESGNTSQTRLMKKNKKGDSFHLRSFSVNTEEDLAKPSTSKCVNEKVNSFQRSLGNFGNEDAYNMSLATRSNCFLDTKMRGNDSNFFINGNQPNMSHSMFTNRISKCSPNLSSISVNNPFNGLNQNLMNSKVKCFNFYGKNQLGYLDHSKYFNVNNIEPFSSVSARKSVFSSGLLPESGGVKNISVNKNMNKVSAKFNAYETLNGTGVIQKDSRYQLNSSQSVLENQTIMKSVLQTSVFSMKEQIMNTLESFGQKLLRSAPEMEETFFKVAKDVKSICENSSIFMNQVMGTTEMFSTLNCTSDRTDFQAQNMLQGKNQISGPSKKPCNILKEIQSGQNEICKVKFLKSFTVEEKKQRNSDKDIFDEKLDFDSPPAKAIKSKEVNLRNWYPIALKEGLAFGGLNDENAEFKTETMKKRFNNRKVLLKSGYVCNLIGEGDPGKNFPPDICKMLRNGIHARWRMLKEKIAKFQKECQENMKVTSSDISSLSRLESSIRTTRQKNRTNLVNVCKGNDSAVCGEADFTSPKSSKIEAQSKQANANKNKERKTDGVKKKEVLESDTTSCLVLKKDGFCESKNTKVERKDNRGSRVIHVTRSGRAVKRPGDMWLGGDFYSENEESERKLKSTVKSPTVPASSESSEEDGTCHLKRKRGSGISGKATVQAKKNKSEEPRTETVQTRGRVSKRRGRIKKSEENSEPKSVNSTLNSESKNPKNKKRKNETTSPEKREAVDSWVNDFDDGLINISELPREELTADIKKMKLISMETPPLKILRGHLKVLRSCTPVTQSPCWLPSQHTESGVKKFERVRAQTFNKKIPKEKVAKNTKKTKSSSRNKEVDAVVNWIGEKEVKSLSKYSKVIKCVIPEKSELEDEDEMEDSEDDKQI